LIRPRRQAGVQGKSGHLTDAVIERLIARWRCLKREHLATLLRPDGDAIGDLRTRELFHRAGFERVANQVAVLRIAFQQPLVFQVAADAPRQGMSQSGKLGAGRCLHPAEPQRAIGTLDVHSGDRDGRRSERRLEVPDQPSRTTPLMPVPDS
jgi:hypothetical protein